MEPDLKLINLETEVTRSDDRWDKGINYRMSPENVPCITAAGIDVCCLSNNHVLDWGYPGLMETLETLNSVGVEGVGVGLDLEEASAPVEKRVDGGGVFSFGVGTSGIPSVWAATEDRPGVNLLDDLSKTSVRSIGEKSGKC